MTPRDAELRRAVGRVVRGARQAADMSQATLASQVGITQAALSNYETGKRDMPLSTARRLVEVLEIEPPVLIFAMAAELVGEAE